MNIQQNINNVLNTAGFLGAMIKPGIDQARKNKNDELKAAAEAKRKATPIVGDPITGQMYPYDEKDKSTFNFNPDGFTPDKEKETDHLILSNVGRMEEIAKSWKKTGEEIEEKRLKNTQVEKYIKENPDQYKQYIDEKTGDLITGEIKYNEILESPDFRSWSENYAAHVKDKAENMMSRYSNPKTYTISDFINFSQPAAETTTGIYGTNVSAADMRTLLDAVKITRQQIEANAMQSSLTNVQGRINNRVNQAQSFTNRKKMMNKEKTGGNR